jgi:hypothetical protein
MKMLRNLNKILREWKWENSYGWRRLQFGRYSVTDKILSAFKTACSSCVCFYESILFTDWKLFHLLDISSVKRWNSCNSSETCVWILCKERKFELFLVVNIFSVIIYLRCGPGSSVGIATAYGVDVRKSNPGGGETFRACPERPWGPPSLL